MLYRNNGCYTSQPDVQSIGIQHSILTVPPIKKLQCKDNNIIEDVYIDEESLLSEAEETDVTSFHFSQEDSYYNRVSTNSSTLINIKLTF